MIRSRINLNANLQLANCRNYFTSYQPPPPWLCLLALGISRKFSRAHWGNKNLTPVNYWALPLSPLFQT